MSILKKTAAALREQVANLEQAAATVPQSAQELLRRFGPTSFGYKYAFDLSWLTRDPAGLVRSIIRDAGVALGLEIGKKLQADYKGVKLGSLDGLFMPHPGSLMPLGLSPRDQAIYEAEVFVLTRDELKALVEKAIRAGREGA